jgi:hypothetical protein
MWQGVPYSTLRGAKGVPEPFGTREMPADKPRMVHNILEENKN